MWQFAEAVAGIGEACRALGTPITGGNVSLYNETDGCDPADAGHRRGGAARGCLRCSAWFPDGGLDIVLLGDNLGELGGSEYLTIVGSIAGRRRRWIWRASGRYSDLVDEASVGRSRSAHDCSDGGFAVTLAECCFDSGGCGLSGWFRSASVTADRSTGRRRCLENPPPVSS